MMSKPTTRRRAHLLAAAAAILAVACSADLSGPPAPLPRAPNWPANPSVIVTDSPRVIWRDQTIYRAEIPFRYVNRDTFSVARSGCGPGLQPFLQWWNGQEWRNAYSHLIPLCGGMTAITAPGDTVSDTLHLAIPVDSIGTDGHPQIPYWTGPRSEADYRLILDMCQYIDRQHGLPTCGSLPLQESVSAPFRMTIDAR